MTENSYTAGDLTEEEEAADDAARTADPARHAILNRPRSAAAHALVDRLAEPFGTPAASGDDSVGGAI